ncbi:hypothetical protein D3C74_488000 [compost metagenome]
MRRSRNQENLIRIFPDLLQLIDTFIKPHAAKQHTQRNEPEVRRTFGEVPAHEALTILYVEDLMQHVSPYFIETYYL